MLPPHLFFAILLQRQQQRDLERRAERARLLATLPPHHRAARNPGRHSLLRRLRWTLRSTRSVSEQDQRLLVSEPGGEFVDVVEMVSDDGDVMIGELVEAWQRPQRVEVVVENPDLHVAAPRRAEQDVHAAPSAHAKVTK